MRFEGYTSREIEVGLTQRYGNRAPKNNTIRTWFARGGRLYDFYPSYATEETRNRQAITSHMFSDHIKNAAPAIVRIMNDPTQPAVSQLRAAQYIINRELGLPPKQVPNSDSSDLAHEIREAAGIIGKTES